MISQETAIERVKELVAANRSMRSYFDAFWELEAIYAYGPQWGYISPELGIRRVQFLRAITDPNRNDIRISLNHIMPDIRKMEAAFAPNRIAARLRPRGGSPGALAIKDTAEKLQEAHLESIGALKWLREKEESRLVYGDVVLRRTLQQLGQPVHVKEDLDFRTLLVGWAICRPWEFLRDPGAQTVEPWRDEEIFCHEKPRTVGWVKKYFGVGIQTDTTMGQLLRHQEQLLSAQGMGRFGMDSKMKGVLVRETYFQDPDSTKPWPTVLFTWTDPSQETDRISVLRFGENPFYGLPFEIFPFDIRDGSPWSRGIPAIEMAGQDLTNIAYSWLARMINEGSGKIMIEDGTVENPSKALNNRLDQPLIWKRAGQINARPPERLQPPVIGQPIMEMLRLAPDWMKSTLNLEDVQFGRAVKRGEAAEAYKVRLAEANTTLEKRRTDDKLRYARFLYGNLIDVVNQSRLDQLRDLLGDYVTDDAIRALKRQPITKSIASVEILPATLHPKTPAETKDEIITLTEAQIMNPADAQWEMMLRGQSVNTAMSESYRRQMVELELLISGEEVRVEIPEKHEYHMRTIEEFLDSTRWESVEEDAKDTVIDHWVYHKQAIMELEMGAMAMGQGAGQPAGAASPPAIAAEAAAGMAPGAVNPAINVA